MNITLRNYQQILYSEIKDKLLTYNKVCVELATGGGKSVIIGKLANNLKGRTLVLTHRVEILQQNEEWLKNVGILNSKENTLRYDTTIVIAMVQTLDARIKSYGMDYIGNFDNIILDEIHVDIFKKVFNKYSYKRLIGFTGTPVLNKNRYFEIDGVEFIEPITLSDTFEVLVCGPTTQWLIDNEYLVQDFNIVLELPDFHKLKESTTQPDGYTMKSLNEVYSNTASIKVLSNAYNEHCKGMKTLVFNASNKITLFIYNHFKSMGLNVKMFDTSGNTQINPDTGKKYKREEIIEWFKNSKDGILINTNVFTTGFNVKDIECIIVNRATKSLGLWIQMVGRGSRITSSIFKDMFVVIDLGQNIYEHGIWSQERNWQQYFIGSGPRRRRQMDMLDTWECTYCGALNIKGELKCIKCGEQKILEETDSLSKKFKDGELQIMQTMPVPRAKSIIEYARINNQGVTFAFKLLERKIIEFFKYYKVSPEFYKERKNEFDTRVKNIYRPIYFAIIKSDLKGPKRRKLSTMTDKLIDKVNEMLGYEI